MIMNDDCDVVDIYLEKLPIKVGQVDKDFRVLRNTEHRVGSCTSSHFSLISANCNIRQL